jgi:hypothetical protein
MTGEIQPSLVKARAADGTSDACAAPCGVHFDASGTTWSGHSKEEADLDLEYRWDFGDPSCSTDGLFGGSGQRCSEARGFVAGHLFENPGTYTVTLCVADGVEGACRSTDVVVSDPNQVYPGTQTVCISTNGDHTGCPAGAQQVSSQSDFDAALNAHLGTDKRVLLHRGQTFQANSTLRFTQSHRNMLLGAYGSGAKPRIEGAGVTLFQNTCGGADGPAPVDTRIVDLEFHDGSGFMQFEDPAEQLTLARVDLTGRWAGNDFGQIYQWRDQINHCESGNSPGPAEQWFLVENDFTRTVSGRNVSMTAQRSAALGNTFGGSDGSHVVRWQVTRRNVISHNQWVGLPKAGLAQLKFHAGKYNDGNFGGVNEYSVVSYNFCNGNSGAWPFTLGQQGQSGESSSAFQRASRMIVERNYFKDSTGLVQIFVRIDADQSRFSENVCEQKVSGSDNITCGHFGVRDWWPMTGHHRAHSNILYDSLSHSFSSLTVDFGIGSNNQARDNIVWAPNGGNDVAVTGTDTCAPGACSDNFETGDFNTVPFASSNPDSFDDYELR